MKKILLICLFVLFPSLIVHAQTCNIYVWNKDGSVLKGPISTAETTRTLTAASEVAVLIKTGFPLDAGSVTCSANCCSHYFHSSGETEYKVYRGACADDGSWERYYYVCGFDVGC
jgi:hypothetical protein